MNSSIHVLIIRLTALGDVVQACDAFRLVRQEFPQVQWHWAVADIYQPLIHDETGLASILSVPRRWTLKKWWAFKKENQHRHFDLIIDTQTLLKSWLVSAALSKNKLVSWGPRQSRDWLAPRMANHVVDEAPTNSRLATLHLYREALKSIQLQSAFPAVLRDGVDFWPRPKLSAHPQIICSVGAGWPTKQLSLAAWSILIEEMRKDYPQASILFLNGSTDEENFLKEALPLWHKWNVSPCAKMTLGHLKKWFREGDLFVGMDSGPSHLAASCGLNTLIFYGPSLPSVYDRSDEGDHAPRGVCHLKAHFEKRCDLLRKCKTCSAITSINIHEAWNSFKKSLAKDSVT